MVWVRHGKGLVHLRQTSASTRTAESSDLTAPSSGSSGGHRVAARAAMPRSTGRGPSEDPLHPVVGRLWHPRYGHPDDFRGDCMRLTDLQRLLDWYPLWVEIKGGSLPMLATRYVITSNQHPADWYTRGDPHGTILRRVRDFAEAHGRLLEFPWSRGP